jgi:hypothetical protein
MTNILIVVRGGVVQDVYSDTGDVVVTLLDHDNIECGQTDLIDFDNYGVAYTDKEHMQKLLDEANKEIEYNNSL